MIKKKEIQIVFYFFIMSVLLYSCSTEEQNEVPVSFSFNENLIVKEGQEVEISIEINSSQINSLDLLINNKKINTWKSPSSSFKYKMNTKGMPLGTRYFSLKATMKTQEIYEDKRAITVFSSSSPLLKKLEIIREYPHNDSNYTQGLEFYKNELYESTGDPGSKGKSMVAKIDMQTGKTIKKTTLGIPYFGEGITILNDTLYQLTWKDQECKVYGVNDFKNIRTMTYAGEGWGICNDGENLITSDGSHKIFFRNPINFEIIKTIEVCTDKNVIHSLNELEYIDGDIYANVYNQNVIVVINALTGGVKAILDANQVTRKGKGTGEVLNGIAYNKQDKKLYLTGKFWSSLFEVEIN